MAWEFFSKTEIPKQQLNKPHAIQFAEAICKLHGNPKPVVFVLLDDKNIPTVHFWGGPDDPKEMSRVLNDIALTIKKASIQMAGA